MVTPTPRATKQKRAIREALQSAQRPLSIEEILTAASKQSRGLGIATVYRSVRTLIDEGFLATVELPGRPALYEVAGKAHHHHFVCESCGAVHELEGCSSRVTLNLPRGFTSRDHEITVYGRCADCGRRSRKAGRR